MADFIIRRDTVSARSLPERRPSAVAVAILALLLVLLPIQRIMLPQQMRPVDAVLVAIIAWWLLRAARSRRRLYLPLLLPAALILSASLFATMTGLLHSVSVIAMIQEVYLFIGFIALVNVLAARPWPQLERLGRFWALIACLEALIIVLGSRQIGPTWFYTSPEKSLSLHSTSGLVRAVGTFVNPNAAAAYLSVSFFVLLSTTWSIRLKIALGALLLVGIVASGSMGALFSTLVALTLIGALLLGRLRRRDVFWIGAATVLVAAAFLIILLLAEIMAFEPLATVIDSPWLELTVGRFARSASSRLALLNEMWLKYRAHPFGTGPNTASLYRGSLHNDYIAFLFERGPLGLFGWLWLVVFILCTGLRASFRAARSAYGRHMLALSAGFLACALNAATHEISHFRELWVFMAFLCAASYIGVSAEVWQPLPSRLELQRAPWQSPRRQPGPRWGAAGESPEQAGQRRDE